MYDSDGRCFGVPSSKSRCCLIPPFARPLCQIIGDACFANPIVHGNGSGAVAPPYVITVLQGVESQAAVGELLSTAVACVCVFSGERGEVGLRAV